MAANARQGKQRLATLRTHHSRFRRNKVQNVRINVSTVQNVIKRTISRDYCAPGGAQSSPKLRYKCYESPARLYTLPFPRFIRHLKLLPSSESLAFD